MYIGKSPFIRKDCNIYMNNSIITLKGKKCLIYADESPEFILIQPQGKDGMTSLDNLIGYIKVNADRQMCFTAFEIKDWNDELTPWEAPQVFGKGNFGHGAADTLIFIENILIPYLLERYPGIDSDHVVLGGYSLGGLFSLWASYNSSIFGSVCGVSPSVWYDGFMETVAEKDIPKAGNIYLSLGDTESNTRNVRMKRNADCIRRLYELLKSSNINTILEWNKGDHFAEPDIRTAKGFVWCLNNI